MTVYEFMKKIGKDEPFFIVKNEKDITHSEPVVLNNLTSGVDEREQIIDVMECTVRKVDFRGAIAVIYCD